LQGIPPEISINKKPKVEFSALDQIPKVSQTDKFHCANFLQVYFEDQFQLSDPETFDSVCQTSGNTASPTFLQDKVCFPFLCGVVY